MLVEARTVMREALAVLLEQQPDLVVVAQADTLAAATAVALDAAPDVVITELDLPDATPADIVAGLKRALPEAAILVLTSTSRPVVVQEALAAGAGGFILKTATAKDLITAIHALGRGETYLQPSLGAELARRQPSAMTVTLSPKEEQVLRFLALGHTNAEVARLCGVSVRTVETHRSRIHQKLGRQTRAELVRYALETGLLFGTSS